jgi:hypothetical protein
MEATEIKAIPCIVRREGELDRVLAFEPLPSTSNLTLRVDREKEVRPDRQVAGYREYSVGGGHIHMAVLSERGEAPSIAYHREPVWIQERKAA